MSNSRKSKWSLNRWTILAMFIAIELVMRLIGLGRVPVGPLYMSFLTVPIAIGAMLLGPVEGMALGIVFGLCSLYDAITGAGGMTNVFFGISPVGTVVLCVGMRALMGWLTGLLFKLLRKVDRTKVVCYYVGALAAPLLNTLLFMGFIVLFFYQTEYIQNLVSAKGAVNPFDFVILLVGVQGLVEALVCTFVGGTAAKGVDVALKRKGK